MTKTFLLYGANGFVGSHVARLAVQSGYKPILAGRNREALERMAGELGTEYRIFGLDEPKELEEGLRDVPLVLHCAGPYIHTFKPMVEACLKSGTHYLDITGEIPVYKELALRDTDAREKGVMLLPGIGFDVAPTDCLAVHLKKRLPSATHLALAFMREGPAGLPPGTQRTVFEMIPYGFQMRREGMLVNLSGKPKVRHIDFGEGQVEALRLTWGDVFTAYISTGISNIESYLVLPGSAKKGIVFLNMLKPLFRLAFVREFFKSRVKPGPTQAECEATSTHIWGEVRDKKGRTAVSRLHGPEAGLLWTSNTAFEAVRKTLSGTAPAGYQTPASAFGEGFVLNSEGVSLEDL